MAVETHRDNLNREVLAFMRAYLIKKIGTINRPHAADLPRGWGMSPGTTVRCFGMKYTADLLNPTMQVKPFMDEIAADITNQLTVWAADADKRGMFVSKTPELFITYSPDSGFSDPYCRHVIFYARVYEYPRLKGEPINDPDTDQARP